MILIDSDDDALTVYPLGEKSMHRICFTWPSSTWMLRPVRQSHTRPWEEARAPGGAGAGRSGGGERTWQRGEDGAAGVAWMIGLPGTGRPR